MISNEGVITILNVGLIEIIFGIWFTVTSIEVHYKARPSVSIVKLLSGLGLLFLAYLHGLTLW